MKSGKLSEEVKTRRTRETHRHSHSSGRVIVVVISRALRRCAGDLRGCEGGGEISKLVKMKTSRRTETIQGGADKAYLCY